MIPTMTPLGRALLLGTGLLASYQIAADIEGLSNFTVTSYTVGFGVLLLAGLLLIIFGYEPLQSPWVVVVSTLIPLSLSAGLISQHLPHLRTMYLSFAGIGLLAILVTRYTSPGYVATIVLATVHGVAGLLIFGLPIVLVSSGSAQPGFLLISLGGALIGVGGLLLAFLRAGRPVLAAKTIFTALPLLLLAMMASFVAGFAWG